MESQTRKESASKGGEAVTVTAATTSGHAGMTTTMRKGVSKAIVVTVASLPG
jgi:hypothetical protein